MYISIIMLLRKNKPATQTADQNTEKIQTNRMLWRSIFNLKHEQSMLDRSSLIINHIIHMDLDEALFF